MRRLLRLATLCIASSCAACQGARPPLDPSPKETTMPVPAHHVPFEAIAQRLLQARPTASDLSQALGGPAIAPGSDATFPLNDAWSLALHAGHTRYTTTLETPLGNGARDPGYSDVGATLKYQLATHWSLSAGLTYATNADFYRHTSSFLDASDTRDVGGSRGFVMLQGSF